MGIRELTKVCMFCRSASASYQQKQAAALEVPRGGTTTPRQDPANSSATRGAEAMPTTFTPWPTARRAAKSQQLLLLKLRWTAASRRTWGLAGPPSCVGITTTKRANAKTLPGVAAQGTRITLRRKKSARKSAKGKCSQKMLDKIRG